VESQRDDLGVILMSKSFFMFFGKVDQTFNIMCMTNAVSLFREKFVWIES
jgi:hypothetical protein